MNRRYDTALFRSRIMKIRELIPDAFIGIDIIAGARGETPEEWGNSYRFVESLPVTHLHVFPYSERPGTAALKLGDAVEYAEKHRRANALIELSTRKHQAFIDQHIGETAEVLWEHPTRHGGMMHGFTRNYIRIEAPFEAEKINTLETIQISAENIAAEQ
jgi:threonylcarbamoyladenosine tRNA methylthiotransferase MtaB